MTVLSAQAVSRRYRGASWLKAGSAKTVLDGISLDIAAGETVALLGRSGCGKSTLARILVGLERPDAGEVYFEGRPLTAFGKADWQDLRCAVQMVFQDPLGAVDPRATVGEVIAEPLWHLCGLSARAARHRVAELLASVELPPDCMDKYSQQLSGGQLQRVCVARALAPGPRLIILDEAVSNLDLHLQMHMLDLFARLRRERQVAYLFVTHDLRLVQRFCTRLLVMAEGRLVEDAPVSSPLVLASREGQALKAAVLPPLPA